jgi:hypothetical protein
MRVPENIEAAVQAAAGSGGSIVLELGNVKA